MKKDYRFVCQDNQFNGEPRPCTLAVFNSFVDSATVAWKIDTRQEIDEAVRQGLSLDKWTRLSDFQRFCLKEGERPKAGEKFRALSTAEQLLRWTNWLKMSLPSFIFGASSFDLMPVLDKFMDNALLAKAPFVRIVHGMGTGALRKAVWDRLKKYNFIAKYEFAPSAQGGSGATIVTLKE